MLTVPRVVQWMNVIRQHKGYEQYRILESFWESQLLSKQWIIDILNKQNISCYGTVYIFGGWFGVLGGMLFDAFKDITKIYSIDIDSNAKIIGEQLNPDIDFITADMQLFTFEEIPTLIINTSTEHISQEVYDSWLKNIPSHVPVILQGNNYFSCTEHIRSTMNITDFKNNNRLDVIQYEGELDCKQFTRYMTIGHKI